MGKRELIWSHLAKIKLFAILDFYTKRNKSAAYSKKLYLEFKERLFLVSKNPEIGVKTELENVRGVRVKDFLIFYEITSSQIIVHTIWDTRRNPDDLEIK